MGEEERKEYENLDEKETGKVLLVCNNHSFMNYSVSHFIDSFKSIFNKTNVYITLLLKKHKQF